MKQPFAVHIAGVEFDFKTDPGLNIIEEDNLYEPFLGSAEKRPDRFHVPTQISIADPPPIEHLPVIFSSGESWIAHQDEASIVLALPAPYTNSKYLWQAHLSDGNPQVTIHCGSGLQDPDLSSNQYANPVHYPLDQLLMMLILAGNGGCIVHSAGIAKDGRGIALIGKSGAGKTTIMQLLGKDQNLVRLSDDRLVIRLVNGLPHLYGTPWAGEGLVAADECVDLAAMVFLHRGENQRLEPISPQEAAHQFIPTTSIPWYDLPRMSGCLQTLDAVVNQVPAFNLYFSRDTGVAEVIEDLFR